MDMVNKNQKSDVKGFLLFLPNMRNKAVGSFCLWGTCEVNRKFKICTQKMFQVVLKKH